MLDALEQDEPSAVLVGVAVAIAVAAVSTAAILIRFSDAPSLVIAFYRLAIASVLLGPVMLARSRREELAALSWQDWVGLGAVGVVLAVHFASWIESLRLTTVAASVVLVTLHPVFVGLASDRLFGEGLSKVGWWGVLVALVGGATIAWGDANRGTQSLIGDALALVGALAAAAYFLAGRGYRRRLSLFAYVVPVYASCSVVLLGMVVVAGNPLVGYPVREYVLFALLAIVPMILGHTILNWALKHVTAPVIATSILGEPVGSTILAFFLLSEVPPWVTLVGGAVVLAGIGLVVYDEESEEAKGVSEPDGLTR